MRKFLPKSNAISNFEVQNKWPKIEKIKPYKENIIILTTSKNQKKIESIKKNGYEVLKYSGKNISANQLNALIIKKRLKFVYFIAGPNIVEQYICKKMHK